GDGVPEGDSRDENPTLEADKTASTTSESHDTGRSALAGALEWFHQQLDRDLPDECDHDTPRDYYRDPEDGRGWDADTVDEKLLGFAPANYKDELIAHLFDRGYGREEILATGLFAERDDGTLYANWRGRYVLPYFDEDGRPVFAISRATDPVHSADWKGNKYDKLQVTRDDVTAEEPIYGLDTVREGEPVLITEGIADAISAHEVGYPCISPVTVQFKKSDREDLLEALGERDVDRAYLIQDAERPTSNVDDRDRLTLQQFGDGVKGAVRTAAYLDDHGLEARVAELPRPGLEKVDLDDYLQGWSDDLTPLLASAKAVDQHPAYDATTAKDVALDAAEVSDLSRDLEAADGDHSALFDLDIRDVTGLSWDYRGENPLGHHGDSENYFILLEDHGVAYDHKYKVAYNALTYLLVDAGERRPASPNGRLEDGEVFAAWRHAKRKGAISTGDPIPHRALQYVTLDHGHADAEELTDGWKLPTGAYNAALETVREEYGVEPGRDEITGGASEQTAVLPTAVRDLTTASSGWDWRHAAEQGDATLTIDDARERTVDAIAGAYTSSDRVLVEALPTMGKSYGAVKAAADTGEPITILTGRGHKEQYGQFKEWCEEHGLTYKQLPSFTHDCDTANGEHGEEWADTVRGWYNRGATPKEIHKAAEYVLGRPLPCQEHEGQRCPYASKWDFDPDTDGSADPDEDVQIDVLIGHYAHAHKTKVTAGRTVVFDEFPDAYETNLADTPRTSLQGAVSYWLQSTDGIPFDSYTDLVENRDDETRRGEALLWFDEHGIEPDETHVFDDESAHATAPLAVYTLLAGTDLGNGYERADLDDVGLGVFDRARGEVSVLQAPALEYASGVVALDGTPTKRMWELVLGERLNHRPVLQGDERAEYVRDALNLNLVRTTEYVKPYNSADHVNTEQDAALLEAIAEEHGEPAAVITTSTAKTEYEDAGLLERDGDGDLTGDGVHIGDTKHYGNVLGSNEFDDTRLGAVIGSNHYGDHFIKKWGAYAGEAVDRGEEKGAGLSYTGFGDDVLQHMREHDTLQAAMRFGRDGNGAVVYVHTDTLPEWVPLAGEGRVVKTWSDGMRAVLEALEDLDKATTADVVEHPAVDLSRQQVFSHLEDLRERGVLTREQDAEDGRRVVWLDDGLHRLGEHGDVDLEPVDLEDLEDEEVRQLARSSTYTWDFTNLPAEDGGSPAEQSLGPGRPPRAPVNGGDGPPDDAD
ncbi:hypothetical protein, partial [Natrialba sp. INN-245]|uniref:hypothetical protein n=1 Tax=Natrialba sp. INN-245 TaxID=2690967 RepID=UPI00190F9A62